MMHGCLGTQKGWEKSTFTDLKLQSRLNKHTDVNIKTRIKFENASAKVLAYVPLNQNR